MPTYRVSHSENRRHVLSPTSLTSVLNSDFVRLIMGFNVSDSFLSMSSICESEAYIRNIPLIVLLFLEDLYPLQRQREGGRVYHIWQSHSKTVVKPNSSDCDR